MLQIHGDTPLYKLGEFEGNNLYVKREDMLPFSFGGNKARKALLFWKDYHDKGCDCLVTYGSSSSNHCRVVANIASREQVPCYIISPSSASETTYNSKLMELFGAHIQVVDVSDVAATIEATMQKLKDQGLNPYFIQGGGHGNIGTQAYVDCYNEICDFEEAHNVHFDYIFHATGTGTTQAGLIAGQMINGDERHIEGISIARKNPYGADVVKQSIRDYLDAIGFTYSSEGVDSLTYFNDSYISGGYGSESEEVNEVICNVMRDYGMPLDQTYTGKAWWGMQDYLLQHDIKDKNVLFIHTGGTPLFFDSIDSIIK